MVPVALIIVMRSRRLTRTVRRPGTNVARSTFAAQGSGHALRTAIAT